MIAMLFTAGQAFCQAQAGTRIYLNSATLKEIREINGVTQKIAENIIEYRVTRPSGYWAAEDLLGVPGMTKDVIARMAPVTDPAKGLYCIRKE